MFLRAKNTPIPVVTNQTPVELLREAASVIVKASKESGYFAHGRAVEELADLLPKWIAVQDPQHEIDELRRELADRGRNLAQATNAYNDLEQAIIEALNAGSLQPLHAIAKDYPSLSVDDYTEADDAGKEGCADERND